MIAQKVSDLKNIHIAVTFLCACELGKKTFKMVRFFTSEQRTFIVKRYLETKSIDEVRESFTRQFPGREAPTRSSNVRKYRERVSSLNCHRGNSGKRRTSRTDENINRAWEVLQENSHLSVRRNNSGLLATSLNRIVRLDLRWHPYKMSRHHELKPNDLPIGEEPFSE